MFQRVISTFPLLQGRLGLLLGPTYFFPMINLVPIPVVASSKYFSTYGNHFYDFQSNSNGICKRTIHNTAAMSCPDSGSGGSASTSNPPPVVDWKKLTNKEWAARLSPEAYYCSREAGTEPPFSGQYVNHKGEGVYKCVCCGSELFTSKAKYDSGSGWPSFWQPVEENRVIRRKDVSHGMVRTELLCATCNAHLGHVFEDGPEPTGERFCMNSICLKFAPKKMN